ncbi:DUF3047 domain-containing protein [Nitrospira defluvii]|nr:DUF3047 domain-containing protein [Nitrospira defluvii]
MRHLFLLALLLWGGMVLISGEADSSLSSNAEKSIVLEDFKTEGENGLPVGWKAQRETPDPAEIYRIVKEMGQTYLHANGLPNRIFKKMKWNPNEYPYITWRWRMFNVPNDPEKEKSATLYIALGTDLIGIPIITKYAWSSNKAVGSEISGGFFRPTTIVLRSGQAETGEWVIETLNVLEDYRRLHNADPPDEAYGIGIFTTIEAEFAEIVAHK